MSVNWNTIPRENLKPFLEKRTLTALRMLAFNWGLITISFALVIWIPAWSTTIIAMVILGGRQLGLGILTHECAHRSFVRSPAAGEWIGTWLCGAPVFVDLEIYRHYHMTHHINTGTAGDPDLANYVHYPVSRKSLLRKFTRDLLGISGLRTMLALAYLYGQKQSAKSGGGYSYKNTPKPESQTSERPKISFAHLIWNLRRILIVNGLMLAAFFVLRHPLVYLLWPASWLTSYMLFSRIRNAAEHGGLPGTSTNDMWGNTRTVHAAWWERLTVAPNYVNYHFEHHLAPTVPSYNLPKMHDWLLRQGAYERATLETGYVQIIHRMTRQNPL